MQPNFAKYFLFMFILVAFTICLFGNAFAEKVNDDSWHKLYIIGHYVNSTPPKPDQIFVAQYKINTTSESITSGNDNIIASVDTTDKGLFELKIPRNIPYHNTGAYTDNATNFDFTVLINGLDSWLYYHPKSNMTEDARKQLINTVTRPPPYPESYDRYDDCYYYFSIPFYTHAEIKIVYGFNGLISAPYHGDNISPSCNPKTIVSYMPPLEQIRAGVDPKNVLCVTGFVTVLHPENNMPSCVKPETSKILIERGWAKASP
jgi:hypothetical protein